MLVSKAAPSFHSEVIVVGAGVIGLAITRALAKAGKEVVLVEKESHICTETSSRNSEVIHAVRYQNKSIQCLGLDELMCCLTNVK